MKSTTIVLLLALSSLLAICLAADPAGPTPNHPATPPPALGDAEKQAGWKLLFDGVSTEGWRGSGPTAFRNRHGK